MIDEDTGRRRQGRRSMLEAIVAREMLDPREECAAKERRDVVDPTEPRAK